MSRPGEYDTGMKSSCSVGLVAALVAVAACRDAPEPPEPRQTSRTADTATGTATGDTAGPLPPIGDECDPVITVPGDEAAAVDAHAEVYGAEPLPREVRLGLPSNDPSRGVGFLWRTSADTLATVVEIGTEDGEPVKRIEGVSYLLDEGGPRIHEVRLCDGLVPGHAYRYRVGGDGGFSPFHTFRTPGEPGAFDTFRVGFLGDSRGAYEQWSQLVHLLDAQDPDLIVFTGDAVESGTNQAEWDAWFRGLGDIPARVPIVFAHGNHEYLSQRYFAQVMLPGNEQWFTVKFGSLHLVVLNDTVDWGSDDLVVQADYIDRSFAEAAPGAIGAAAHHQGMYATCTTHRSNTSLRDLWVPRYDAHGVRLVFNGHNHLYERSVPIRHGVEVPPAAGATYITSGGAGGPLYPNFDPTEWFAHTAVAKHHYGVADFGPDGIHVVVRDPAGNVIDVFDR
jgi:hypothetical protein